MPRRVPVIIALAIACVALLTPARAAVAADAADVNSLGLEASYDVTAAFNWRAGTADVRTKATITGTKPWTSNVLAFNLQILRIGHAQITTATVNGAPVHVAIDDQTIVVPLDPPLAPGGICDGRDGLHRDDDLSPIPMETTGASPPRAAT